MELKVKEKITSATSIFSSVLSFMGGYQVCHSICLSIVSLLSVFGVTLTVMPLLFLTKVAVPFWIAAVAMLSLTFAIYLKKKCISKNLMVLNTGLIVIAIPFKAVQDYSYVFWTAGMILVLLSLFFYIKNKIGR